MSILIKATGNCPFFTFSSLPSFNQHLRIVSIGDVPKRDENIYSVDAAKPVSPRSVCLTFLRLISKYLRTDRNIVVTVYTTCVAYDS